MTSRFPGSPVVVSFENFEWKTRLNSTKVLLKHESARVRVDMHPLQRFSSQISHATVGQSSVSTDSFRSLLDGNDPLSLLQKQTMRQLFENEFFDDPEVNDGAGTSFSSPRRRRVKNSQGIKASLNYDDFNTEATIDIHRLKIEISDHLAFDSEFLRDFRRLNYTELPMRMDRYCTDVVTMWGADERVEALRTVILCAKLLMDTENPVLYPLKYVCTAEIFDKFGNRVYERLKNKSEPTPTNAELLLRRRRPEPIVSKVPGSAQETCLNWFNKIASIRELVPRLYAEAALLRCYSFLDEERIVKELKKLIKLTRAVGDLIVNLYLRCYLCQVAMECRIMLYNYFRENFDDFMITLNAFLARDDFDDIINLHRYLETLLPGLEWLLKGIIDRDYNIQEMFLKLFRSTPNNSIMLLAVLQGFEESFIIEKMDYLMEWLHAPELAEVPKYRHLINLGRMYENYRKKSADVVPENVLKTVWDEIERLIDPNEYLNVLELWLPLSENCLPCDRVNSILQIFGPHVAREQLVERQSTRVENVVRNLTRYVDDFYMLLISEYFLPFLHMIPNVQLRVTVCKIIMEALVQRSDYTFICDSVTLDSVMIVAKTVHDSIRMSTVEDERKQIGNLLAKFVRLVQLRDEFDKQLDFYVEARKIFYQLDIVLETLIHCVNALCFERLKSVKGNHDSRSLEFAQSCIAYNFITIPSLNSPVSRLQLLIISGQVALANQSLDMAASYFSEAIHTMKKFNDVNIDTTSTERVRRDYTFERTSHKEIILKSYASQLMSILIVLPDDPDGKSVFRLCSRLVRAINSFEWKDPTMQPSLMIMFMRMYSVGYQEIYPYHFLNVDSNDTLYGADELFRQKLDTVINNLMHDVLRSIVQLSMNDHYASLMIIVEELLAIIFAFGDLTNKSLAVLSIQLWSFCRQIPFNTKVLTKNWIMFCLLMTPPESPYEFILKKIKSRLRLDGIPSVRVVPTTLSI